MPEDRAVQNSCHKLQQVKKRLNYLSMVVVALPFPPQIVCICCREVSMISPSDSTKLAHTYSNYSVGTWIFFLSWLEKTQSYWNSINMFWTYTICMVSFLFGLNMSSLNLQLICPRKSFSLGIYNDLEWLNFEVLIHVSKLLRTQYYVSHWSKVNQNYQ